MSRTRIAVIGCSARKFNKPARALEMYQGTRFRLAIRWADRHHAVPYFVLSAKHGLVGVHEKVAPYDRSISDLSPAELETWGKLAASHLHRLRKDGEGIVILAEDAYADPIRFLLPKAQFPLTGMDEEAQKEFLAS